MNFDHELKQLFLKVALGEIEPTAWATWWNSHKSQLEKLLTRGDMRRIMPALWSPNYYWMAKTQKGVSYYFHTQGRPVKCSDYYEQKAQEERIRDRQRAIQDFLEQTAPARKEWEMYLNAHPTEDVSFDWKSLLGTPSAQKPPQVFSYKTPYTTEQWKETNAELKLRLKENIQAKIAPLAKAYGMKKTGPQTFLKETNGLVSCLQFIGYFRGGGYESIWYSLGPIYDIHAGVLGIPGFITHGELFQKMNQDWGVIQFTTEGAIDAERIKKINSKFDDILTFLAEGVFPEWNRIKSLEAYFAKERRDYLKATEVGPVDPYTNRPMWDLKPRGEDPWRADAYLFGVWDLLSGKEAAGYQQLATCVKKGAAYMQQCLKDNPKAYNDKRDSMAVLYHNAELFLQTGQIPDTAKRRQAILDTYKEVCRFMRYYHGLSGKTER